MIHPTTKYAKQVISGKIVACKWVQLCCQRHLDDLETGKERGLKWVPEKANHALEFFGFLKHSKGEWADKPFVLEPWEQFIVGVLFGWVRSDGFRRFRTAYIEVSRKNGKTTLLSAIGLYLFFADGEAGSEVYSAATKKEQAKISHSEATRMVNSSPGLKSRIGVFRDNLHILGTASKFEPLGADADTLDGLNTHGGLVDELHAHKTRDMWEILESSVGSRRQPLMIAITTAGFNRQSICWEQHDYAEKILEGSLKDDSYFGIIYTIDKGDKWDDEKVWIKANPNLEVTAKLDDLQRKCEQAKKVPTKQNSFKRRHLDIWTQAETRWLSYEKWEACEFPISEAGLKGRKCYGGLDLSSNEDITAFLLVFPPVGEEDNYKVLCRFWIPKDNIQERVSRARVPYDMWVREGYLIATTGNVVDHAFILDQIDKDAQTFDIEEIAFDRWGATQIIQDIQEKGLSVVQFGQGYGSMSRPTKELERMVLSGEIAHNGNPVLSWMASNVVVRMDPAGNIKCDKEKSTEKIDGIVALIMGLDRALVKNKTTSKYENEGMVFL